MTTSITETPAEGARRRKQARIDGPTPESAHGKANGYNNYGCKCDPCMAWSASRAQRRRDAAKDLAQYATPKEKVQRSPIVWTPELIRSLLK